MKKVMGKKGRIITVIVCCSVIVILLSVVYVLKTQKQVYYNALNQDDKQVADIYARMYETPVEDIAEMKAKSNDWETVQKQLDIDFFTIGENIKYQMEKEGYALEDLYEAEKLSQKTGKRALSLAKAKGKAAEGRKWSEVVSDEEIKTTEEQLGLSEEQVKELEKRKLNTDERIDIAILCLNGTYTWGEILKELDQGKKVPELAKR
ncbi:MAG: hypothetical protein J1F22_08000 [Lachnospiraceae bacterium]|nr:hypothetical protein [Lachnospiraceae bacterium]